MNLVTVHDGFTMYDLFSYDQKVNGCGPLNPVCCDNPLSGFCDRDSGESNNRSRNWGLPDGNADTDSFKRQQMRNLFTALAISHGTPLILGGDEWMRTQLGNNNAYSSKADNPYNWYQWGTWQAQDGRKRMHDFVRQLLAIRKAHIDQLSPASYDGGQAFKWMNEGGNEGPDWGSRHVAVWYPTSASGKGLYLILNMEAGHVTFQFPAGTRWNRLVDTQSYFDLASTLGPAGQPLDRSQNATLDAPVALPGTSYDTPGYTMVVLEAAP